MITILFNYTLTNVQTSFTFVGNPSKGVMKNKIREFFVIKRFNINIHSIKATKVINVS